MKDFLFKILFILIGLTLLFWIGHSISQVFAESPTQPQIERQNLFLQAYLPPVIFINEEVIACLIFYESSGNPNALGDNGLAHGILQFHEPTFKGFCVDKYGLPDDIWNEDVQMDCCDRMISDGRIDHWSTAKLCK